MIKNKESAAIVTPAIVSPETVGNEAKAETAASLLQDAREEIFLLSFGKHKVNVARLEKTLADTYTDACRLSKVAELKGLGRVAKDMTGGGTLIPTPAVINDLYTIGELGAKTDKKTALRKDRLKGLNMLVDALALLGEAKRS